MANLTAADLIGSNSESGGFGYVRRPEKSYVDFLEHTELASERMGGEALAASDEFFASKQGLLKFAEPIFVPDKYTEFGKWMDGWESRRKRGLRPGNDHDWCVVRLGAPGIVRGVDIDTAFFVGNYPEFASIDYCESETDPDPQGAVWKPLLLRSRLQGGSHNFIAVREPSRATHLRLNIFPDGGVARLRVYGEVSPNWTALSNDRTKKGDPDLACAANGGRVIGCNDMFFGGKDNLIFPTAAANMGDGWETRRRRGEGHDWIVIRLARSAKVSKIDVSTRHFKGNYPDRCSIEALTFPSRNLTATDLRDRADLVWRPILPSSQLKPDFEHSFTAELRPETSTSAVDYLRLNIFPDGGISRLRAYGTWQ